MLDLILLSSIIQVHNLINYQKILINGVEIQHHIFLLHHCLINNKNIHQNISHQIKCLHHQMLLRNIHNREMCIILIHFLTNLKVESRK